MVTDYCDQRTQCCSEGADFARNVNTDGALTKDALEECGEDTVGRVFKMDDDDGVGRKADSHVRRD